MFPRVDLGHGIGLRPRHHSRFLDEQPRVDWVEATSEAFMGQGGRPLAVLDQVRAERPVALHGLCLAIGSVDPLDERYLREWKALVDRVQPALVSDHLCWGRHQGRYAHEPLPLPYTEEALAHVVSRVGQVQERLGRQIMLENVSSSLAYPASTLSEHEFLVEVARRADCGILLDIAGVYESARNHGVDGLAYLDAMPVEHVGQFHLRGHLDRADTLVGTHEGLIGEEVWKLYAHAVERLGRVATLVECDGAAADLDAVLAQSEKARTVEYETFERVNAEAEKRMLG